MTGDSTNKSWREGDTATGKTLAMAVLPEPGQLVEVRRRQWVATEIAGNAFAGADGVRQHVVSLASLDEDSMGEELDVVWEIEPGAQVLERAGLPAITGWDPPERLDAFLDAVRWGAVTNADKSFLQSPFRSGISIEDYQLDPLIRAIDMARVNLLIADDVGLGKTIEAGLVIQEMLIRHRARTVLVVCPASLQIKWQSEMQEKFGLEFRIVDADYLKRLRRERGIRVNPWTSYPRLIASMDWMKGGEGLRLLKDILPAHVTYPRVFDILVVDEAHNVAPSSGARGAAESQRTSLIRLLAPHFGHRLFISATPHNGYQESFTSLLELLDDQRFARSVMPNEEQLQRVMVRRLKSDIVDPNGKPLFPLRKLEALEVDYTAAEQNIHQLLQRYTASRAATAKGQPGAYGVDFVNTLLKKRLFSSPLAFATTLEKHRDSLAAVRHRPKISLFDDRILRSAIQKAEEDYADDHLAEEAQHEAIAASGSLTPPLGSDEQAMLDSLSAWSQTARHQADSKAEAILFWLKTHLKPKGMWSERRVILFTEYRATHIWAHDILVSHGFGGDRLMCLHGDIPPEERETIKAAFQASPSVSPVRILLATDAASEGIDLQNHCNYMIHIEIPWNPNVMEQRNGRIDRHGQKESVVHIWHPVGRGFTATPENQHNATATITGDHEYLMRAVLKIDTIREDLGSVGPVIARQIEEAMMGRRGRLDTTDAEARAAKSRRFIASEKKLQERIARLHNRLLDTRDGFHLTPANIGRAVRVALDLADKPPLRPTDPSDSSECAIFDVPALPGSWGRATSGLEHPHTRERRPITFDHQIAKGRDDVVLAHLNHKLVQMSLRLLREEVWKLDDVKRLNRVTVRSLPAAKLPVPAVAVWSRLVITGGDQRRLHEELTLSGGELDDSRYARIPQISRLEALLAESAPCEPSPELFKHLQQRFARHEAAILSTADARSRDRLRFLESALRRRQESETNDLQSILDDLEASIRRELEDDAAPEQLLLFDQPAELQLKRDIQALHQRLARIPNERIAERSIIEKHYANPVDRTFPVAVVFLVPKE